MSKPTSKNLKTSSVIEQDASEKIREGQARRARDKKKSGNNMNQYYFVIGGFCFTMVATGVYTLLNPATSFATMPIIDESAILVHNG